MKMTDIIFDAIKVYVLKGCICVIGRMKIM